MSELVLNADALKGHSLLYPVGWSVALCAANPVVEALRSHQISGVYFQRLEVS